MDPGVAESRQGKFISLITKRRGPALPDLVSEIMKKKSLFRIDYSIAELA